jgi:hypothetical protein
MQSRGRQRKVEAVWLERGREWQVETSRGRQEAVKRQAEAEWQARGRGRQAGKM